MPFIILTVSVVEDNVRTLAAELQNDLLQIGLACRLHDESTHLQPAECPSTGPSTRVSGTAHDIIHKADVYHIIRFVSHSHICIIII